MLVLLVLLEKSAHDKLSCELCLGVMSTEQEVKVHFSLSDQIYMSYPYVFECRRRYNFRLKKIMEILIPEKKPLRMSIRKPKLKRKFADMQ